MKSSRLSKAEQTACFSVLACADPGVLPRVLELFAKRGLVPGGVQVDRMSDGEGLSIEIQMNDMEQDLAVYIGECIRGIFTVDQVLVSEVRQTEVA